MNTSKIDQFIKRKDDPNKKATFFGKVGVWGVVIGCGLIRRSQIQLQEESKNKQSTS